MADRRYKDYGLKDFISKKKNVLFVTGYMGSGKSTLATSFGERYNAKVFALDFVFDFNSLAFHNQPKEIRKFHKDFLTECGYYTQYDEVYGSFTKKWSDDSNEDRCITIITHAIKSSNPSNRIIVEGIQLYTYTSLFEYLMDCPLVILDSSPNAAKISDIKRAMANKQPLLKLLIDHPYKNDYYSRHESLFKNFLNRVEHRKGTN